MNRVIQGKLRALCVAAGLSAFGCGAAPTRPTPLPAPDAAPVRPTTGRILIECTPPDALVIVDGAPRGRADELSRAGELTVPLGLHRFEITRDGFRAFRIELNVGEKPERLRVQLKPVAAAP